MKTDKEYLKIRPKTLENLSRFTLEQLYLELLHRDHEQVSRINDLEKINEEHQKLNGELRTRIKELESGE